MTTVFLSGSRAIGRLNDMIRERISNIVSKEFEIVIGDANGADKAMQGYLNDLDYRHVRIYCSGERCRNNLGDWPVENIEVDGRLKGRDFYAVKDKKMASDADFGFVLWDGKSAGSIGNVIEMIKQDKSVLIYVSKSKSFETVSSIETLLDQLRQTDPADREKLSRKLNLNKSLRDIDGARQESLDF